MNIGFTKMHGLGNDFVVVDNFNGRIILSKKQISFLCDRHRGIGADGLILVESGKEDADCFMNYYNSNGSEAEMCGNGIRCVARFLKDYYLKFNNSFKIKTKDDIKEVIIEEDDDNTFSVNMGKPFFYSGDFPEKGLEIEGFSLDFVSMGNPHAVAFVDDMSIYDLSQVGPIIENNSNFPNKINFEIVEKKNKKEFSVKVWERGCGITSACGTGACAVYALARKNRNADKNVIISLPGGKLYLSENIDGEIIMRGEAINVFSGIIDVI
jgi:diaminopimelate epimerase